MHSPIKKCIFLKRAIRYLPALAGCLLLTVGAMAMANPVLDQRRIAEGEELMMQRRYSEAMQCFQEIIDADPAYPAGYMYQAVVLQAKMMDFEDYHEESLFFALMDTAIAKSQRLIQGHATEAEAWLYFYLGMAQGFKGVHEGKLERWWSAFRDGWRGVGNLKRAVRIAPDLHDAQLGIGSFTYWRSRMMRKLRWLPVIQDEREEGIALVQRAAAKSRYSRIAARTQLVWILMKEGRYDEAIALSSGLSEQYPDYRVFKWGWAEGLKHKRAWDPALKVYREMLASYEADPQSNHYSAIQCRWKIATISFEQKQFAETVSQCRRILRYDLDEANQERLKDKLARVRRLLKRAEARLR
ncbi:MAG: hypothetical protein KAJ05_02305 [Candidatus Latescibacteria bacterium]|nr:hypothetical protein [Candidatus Latescibacterota bacterium]